MQQQRDHYITLKCAPNASSSELQRCYREAKDRYSPDNPDNADRRAWAESRYRAVVDAFNQLHPPDRRMVYDHQTHLQARLARKAAVLKEKAAGTVASGTGGGGFLSRLFRRASDEARPTAQDADRHFDKGVTLANATERYEDARQEFRLAVAADPTHLEAVYNLALMEYKLGRFGAARDGFRQVLALDPTDFYSKLMTELLTDEPEP